jgi:predicted transcriptional regulator
MKTSQECRQLEYIYKGVANHRRLQIMFLLHGQPEFSVDDIAEKLKTNLNTIGDHIRKLAIAGLVMKRNDGPFVRHKLTNKGNIILASCKMLV